MGLSRSFVRSRWSWSGFTRYFEDYDTHHGQGKSTKAVVFMPCVMECNVQIDMIKSTAVTASLEIYSSS